MIAQEVIIPNPLGMHARAAAKLVQTANRFRAKFQIEKENQKVNGKSILGILLLAAGQGSKLRLVFDGEDETEASKEVVKLVNDGFGEMDGGGEGGT